MKAWQEQHLRRLLETAASTTTTTNDNDDKNNNNPQLQQQMVMLARDFLRAVHEEATASSSHSVAEPSTTLRVVDDMLSELHSKMAPMQRELSVLERTRKALVDQATRFDRDDENVVVDDAASTCNNEEEVVDALSVSDLGTEPESMDLETVHTRATASILRSRQNRSEEEQTKNYRSELVQLAGRRRNQASGERSSEEMLPCKRRKISM